MINIHKNNVKKLEAIAEFLLEELGLPSFSTNAASYMGLFQQNSELIGIDDAERTLAMETLLQLNRKYDNRIHAQAGPLAEAKRWGEMVQKIPAYRLRVSLHGKFWTKIEQALDQETHNKT